MKRKTSIAIFSFLFIAPAATSPLLRATAKKHLQDQNVIAPNLEDIEGLAEEIASNLALDAKTAVTDQMSGMANQATEVARQAPTTAWATTAGATTTAALTIAPTMAALTTAWTTTAGATTTAALTIAPTTAAPTTTWAPTAGATTSLSVSPFETVIDAVDGTCNCMHFEIGQSAGCSGECCSPGTAMDGGHGWDRHCRREETRTACVDLKNGFRQHFCAWTTTGGMRYTYKDIEDLSNKEKEQQLEEEQKQLDDEDAADELDSGVDGIQGNGESGGGAEVGVVSEQDLQQAQNQVGDLQNMDGASGADAEQKYGASVNETTVNAGGAVAEQKYGATVNEPTVGAATEQSQWNQAANEALQKQKDEESKKRMDELKQQIYNLSQKLQAAEYKNQEADMQKQLQKQKEAMSQQKIDELRSRIAVLNERVQAAENKTNEAGIAAKLADAEKAEQRSKEALEENLQKQQQMETEQKAEEAMQKVLQKQKEEESQRKIGELENDIADLKVQLEAAENEKKSMQDVIVNNTVSIENERKNKELIKLQLQTAEAKLEAAENEKKIMHDVIVNNTVSIENERKNKELARLQLQTAEAKVAELEKDLGESQSDLERSKAETARYKQKVMIIRDILSQKQ